MLQDTAGRAPGVGLPVLQLSGYRDRRGEPPFHGTGTLIALKTRQR
jgi:hypothetical protein